MVVVRERGGGQHANAQAAGNHVANRVQRAALQRVCQPRHALFCRQFAARAQHLVAHAVALGEQQHVFFRDVFGGNRIQLFKAMPLGHNHKKRLVIQRNRFHARFRVRLRHHNRIHIGAFEHFGERGGVVLFQHQRHFRRNLAHG